MIPLPNRERFLRLLKDGADIRHACKEASITRSNLYKYFKEMPGFREEVNAIIKDTAEHAKSLREKADADNLLKIKMMIKNRKR